MTLTSTKPPPAVAANAVAEYERRMKFIRDRIEEAERLKVEGDWGHVFEVLSATHRELALCLMDAAFLR